MVILYMQYLYGPFVANSCKKNFSRKKKFAIKTIAGLKYNDHTKPFFKKHEILPLPSLISIQFMQRFKQGFLPAAFDDTWTSNAIKREGQNQICLRNNNNLYIPPARLSQTLNHPLTNLPRIWESIAEVHSVTILRDKKGIWPGSQNSLLEKTYKSYQVWEPFLPFLHFKCYSRCF